jgi:hypothetical protein
MRPGSPLAQEWFTAAELAAMMLPDMPSSARGVSLKAEREFWAEPAQKGVWWRERAGRGGGVEYHLSVLPREAQAKLCLMLAVNPKVRDTLAPSDEATDARWAWFERQTTKKKDEAHRRLKVLQLVRDLSDNGMPKTAAVERACQLNGVGGATYYAWEKLVHRVPRHHWLAFLAPRHAGQAGARVAFTEKAWEFIASDYLRLERPTVAACYRRLERAAAVHGWTVPCRMTVQRKLLALPPAMVTLARHGNEALKRMYPPQERDRSAMHSMQVVNADFHTWDVFVRFPDGTIDRPAMIAFQDIYSGKILSWRLDRNPNKHAVRLAFGDLVEALGIPEQCVLDNGREFASKWITGGTPTRYRFKVKEEEPQGLLVSMGVEVHWATPYAGQSKPIERAFRDMAGDTAKHPAFAGAYVGNKPTAKPENYGDAAVPFDTFLAVLQGEIAEHNARVGRQGGVCAGRSFDAVFNESYATSVIRKASPDQRRLWLMAAEVRTVDRQTGQVELEGNRFWSSDLQELCGRKVVVRFDPQNFQAPLHVYRPDGMYLGAAPCIAKSEFINSDQAKQRASDVGAYKKANKQLLAAHKKLTAAQVAALTPAGPHEPAPPESKVVQMWGNTARQLAPVEAEEMSETEAALMRQNLRFGPRLVE